MIHSGSQGSRESVEICAVVGGLTHHAKRSVAAVCHDVPLAFTEMAGSCELRSQPSQGHQKECECKGKLDHLVVMNGSEGDWGYSVTILSSSRVISAHHRMRITSSRIRCAGVDSGWYGGVAL